MYKPRSRRNCTLYSFPRTFAQIFSNAVQGQLRHIDGNITVIQFSRHASVDTTNVLSSYFTTVGMHRFAWSTVGTYCFSEWVQIFQNSWLEKYCAHACILLGKYVVRTAHDKWQSPKTDFRTELKSTFLERKPDPLRLLLHIFTRHEETPSARVLCLVYNFSILATPQHKRQCKVSIQNV